MRWGQKRVFFSMKVFSRNSLKPRLSFIQVKRNWPSFRCFRQRLFAFFTIFFFEEVGLQKGDRYNVTTCLEATNLRVCCLKKKEKPHHADVEEEARLGSQIPHQICYWCMPAGRSKSDDFCAHHLRFVGVWRFLRKSKRREGFDVTAVNSHTSGLVFLGCLGFSRLFDIVFDGTGGSVKMDALKNSFVPFLSSNPECRVV